MIYTPPTLTAADADVLALIGEQKERLRLYTQHSPKRWFGSLRRTTFARAIQGSNSIEGYNASIDDAIAAVEDEPPMDERSETWFAIKGYRDAMTYIIQASQDSYFEFSKQFLKSLHFMMIGHDLSKYPGQWRPGAIYVVDQKTNKTVYEAPDVDDVNPLIEELVDYLRAPPKEPVIIRAAISHLNLTMIHPFKDGNGRMARALQTLVLAREGILTPIFCSIEEWLGRNTIEYYHVLAEVGQGRWNPGNDSLPWIRFCLKAHYQQAATLIRRNEEYEKLYNSISHIVDQMGYPDRTTLPLFDAALGQRLTNSRYRLHTNVTEFVASRDLRRLSEDGLLEPTGERRGRVYSASPKLKEIRNASRIRRPLDDPYAVVAARAHPAPLPEDSQPRLPGV